MPIFLRISLTLTLLLCTGLASGGTPSATAADVHVNPGRLNEQAIRCMQRGDDATASILLERAARLAPRDTRIARNLQAVREILAQRSKKRAP
ncbi:MAG: hypothetical protein M0T86_05660 [Betaproteobacteria bacterium]|nr:hypothetical protein [Betaproteobacteria bacterium]